MPTEFNSSTRLDGTRMEKERFHFKLVGLLDSIASTIDFLTEKKLLPLYAISARPYPRVHLCIVRRSLLPGINGTTSSYSSLAYTSAI